MSFPHLSSSYVGRTIDINRIFSSAGKKQNAVSETLSSKSVFAIFYYWRPRNASEYFNRTGLSYTWAEILIEIACFDPVERSRTPFQKPLLRKVSFLSSIIWRPRHVSQDRLPY